MAIPILGARKARRQADIDAAVSSGVNKAVTAALAQAAVQKAMSPAVAAAAYQSGATYGVNTSSPFNQVGPGAGFVPLPRPDGTFDSGFGPGYPLFPDAIDPLGANGRTLTRRTQYLVSANLQLIDRRIPWSVLKGLAEDVDVIQRCIQCVQDALVGLDWSWGFSPHIITQIMDEQDLTNSAKATAIAREKFGDELNRVQQFFEYPDKKMGFTFDTWLTDIIASHLTFDGVVIAPSYNLGGELTSLSTIDTSTIKILLDNQGFIPQPPAPAYQQILYGFPRGEYQAEDMTSDGKVPNGFTGDQLAYYIRRPHASNLYGYSQVEECINIATIYMERQGWLHAEYSHGVTPKMFIETMDTESWTPEQLSYYERTLNDQWSGQTQRRQQLMLGRPGMKPTQLKGIDEAYKSDYDAWLVMQMGAKFGIPQSMLGIQMHSSIGGGAAGKQQGDQAEQYATDAMKNWLVGIINDMARRFLGVGPELTMTSTGGGNDDDDLTRAQADEIDVNTGIRTRNEIRAERGIPLMNEPEADQLGVTIATGVSFLSGALEAQQTAAALAAQPPQPKAVTVAPDGTRTETPVAPGEAPPSGASVSGSSTTSASVGSTSASVAPKAKDKLDVDAKDDPRQPDTDAEKELATFAKWARTHVGRNSRDFQFQHVDAATANQLNDAARIGDLTVIKSLISAAKSGTTSGTSVRVIDPYAHIPDDIKRLQGIDAYPDVVVEKVTLDYNGKPRSVETTTVHGDAPRIASKAVEVATSPEAARIAKYLPDLSDDEVLELTKNELLIKLLDERDHAVWMAKTEAQAVDLGAIVAKQLAPDFQRLEETRLQLLQTEVLDAVTKANKPTVHVHMDAPVAEPPVVHVHTPEQEAPIVNVAPPEVTVDATSTHTHNVAAPEVTVQPPEVHVDASQTHNVAAPQVDVHVPEFKVPKPQVTVQQAAPARKTIKRGDDGSITIESE